jgi:hypothetical protein
VTAGEPDLLEDALSLEGAPPLFGAGKSGNDVAASGRET